MRRKGEMNKINSTRLKSIDLLMLKKIREQKSDVKSQLKL
jgi:hypothetical protein